MDYEKYSRNYNAWLMCDTKWRKALAALVELCDKRIQLKIKTIDGPMPFFVRPPEIKDIGLTRFNDGAYQPFGYKWIEWICIPGKQVVKEGVDLYREQDLNILQNSLNLTIKLNLKMEIDGLYIFGYRKIEEE